MKNLLVAAIALACIGCANYMKVEVEGRVVDEAGRPVPGAKVTTAPWTIPNASQQVVFAVTDDEGRFSATLPRSMGGNQALFARLDDDRRGGFVAFQGDRGSELRIVVQPLLEVRAEIDQSLIPASIRAWGPSVNATSTSTLPALVATNEWWQPSSSSVTWRLPAGRYTLTAYGAGQPATQSFEVSDRDVDLGAIEIEPYKWQELLERPAPELRVADARGVPKNFKLSSLRGKWVALVFWNHRMEANPHILPAYADLYESRTDMRDRFEILVVHQSDDVLTINDLETALWRKDVRLPMPVIIDDTEKTFEAYGLERGPMFRSAPQEFLIDPQGRVVAHGFGCFRLLAMNVLGVPSKK